MQELRKIFCAWIIEVHFSCYMCNLKKKHVWTNNYFTCIQTTVSFENKFCYSQYNTFIAPTNKENFFVINPTIHTNFANLFLFWLETLHVSDSSSVRHQEFIHCTLKNVMCHTGLQTAVEQDHPGIIIIIIINDALVKKIQ